MAQILLCKNNVALTDGLFRTYCALKNIFDYLKTYHQISPEPEIEQTLILLT